MSIYPGYTVLEILILDIRLGHEIVVSILSVNTEVSPRVLVELYKQEICRKWLR